jgi:hypothetical protein
MSAEELAAWDAEIEADFQRIVRATRRSSSRQELRGKHIGCPLQFFIDVCQRTKGRTALVVAIYLYRQKVVNRSAIVSFGDAGLAELGISRKYKCKALRDLEAAGIVQLHLLGPGKKLGVELLWRP